MTRRVVLTADDLGRDDATTEVIGALLAEGHVTATTLITVSPVSERAVNLVRSLGVVPHLHVTLSGERGLPRWRPLGEAPSLVDRDGDLTDDPMALAGRATTVDIRHEMDAQLTWMRERGLPPQAVDSHAGVLYGLYGRAGGSVLADALRWCARQGLAFRLPRDPVPWWGGPLPPPLQAAHEQAVALADSLGVSLPATVVTNRRAADDLGGYEALRDHLVGSLVGLPEGTSELFLHPSRENAVRGPDGLARTWEARLLRDPMWHRTLQHEGIDVVAQWWP